MYFSSSVGKGFIMSDEEEVTGVISVRNKVEIQGIQIDNTIVNYQKSSKRNSSFREKISDTINDTLRRKKKQKYKKEPVEFLYINRPDFSSDESLGPPDDTESDVKVNYKTEVIHAINMQNCK